MASGDHNAVLFVTAEGTEEWPMASKADIAEKLAQRIEVALA